MRDKFEEFGFEFKNEATREEEADEEGLDVLETERNHFEELEY